MSALILTKESGDNGYRVTLNPLLKPFVTEVTIPAEHKGLPVRVIGKNAFSGAKRLKSISIPASISCSCEAAFCDCSVESVHITDLSAWCKINFETPTANPLHSGARLYLNGKLLKKIDLNGEIQKIGSYAFYGCKQLISLSLTGVDFIGEDAFRKSGLKNITVPEEVTHIGDGAFANCYNLTDAKILGGSKISRAMFEGCEHLTDIRIDNSVTAIERSAFYGCTRLAHVELPRNLRVIGYSAFKECRALKEIELPSEIEYIGEFAFEMSGIESITIPHGVDSIQTATFQICKKLEEVKIPRSVTRIEKSAFHLCDSLKTVNYAGTAEEWEEVSFPSGYPFKNSVRIYCYESSYHGKNAE